MPFCNVKDDVAKIKTFLSENKDTVKSTEEFNELLKACVLMELASFIGFWNVQLGYHLARSMKDAMCNLCKGEEEDIDVDNPDKVRDHLNKVRMEPYQERDKITKKEKVNLYLWLQYMNNLSNACPSLCPPKQKEPCNTNTYQNMVNGSVWGSRAF